MQRKYIFLIIAIILIALVGVFFRKNVGGPLCGPVCTNVGLHYYEKPCFGLKLRSTVIDGYSDICYGLSIGEKKCFGVLYSEEPNLKDIQLDCDYPCNDDNVKIMCQTQESLTFGDLTIHCDALRRKCGW